MNRLLYIFFSVQSIVCFVSCEELVWKRLWNDGDRTYNKLPSYGPLGEESILSQPPALAGALGWWDGVTETFLLFGGRMQDMQSIYRTSNALWSFNTRTQLWTWMGGNETFPSSQGEVGIASPANWPLRRGDSCTWTTNVATHCMYGGYSNPGNLADLWCWDGKYWTLVQLNAANSDPVFGTLGTPAPTIHPGARYNPCCTTDLAGNLWLYGGFPFARADLWKWDGQMWTWVSGITAIMSQGNYGTQGVPSATNTPAGRGLGMSWFDYQGNMWLWGGFFSYGNHMDDLWKWDGANWTWISGTKAGSPETPISFTSDTPAGRGYSTVWTTPSRDKMWLYGGARYYEENTDTFLVFEDLWTVENGTWRYLGGNRNVNLEPTLNGTLWPGARSSAVGFMDQNNLCLFGGFVKMINYTMNLFPALDTKGDLWQFGIPVFETSPPVGGTTPIAVSCAGLFASSSTTTVFAKDASRLLYALITIQQLTAAISLNKPALVAFSDAYNTLKYVNGDFAKPSSIRAKVVSSICFGVAIGTLFGLYLKGGLWQVKIFFILINRGTLFTFIRLLWIPFIQSLFGLYAFREHNTTLLLCFLVVFALLFTTCLVLGWFLKKHLSLFATCSEPRSVICRKLAIPLWCSPLDDEELPEIKMKSGYLKIRGKYMIQIQEYTKQTSHVLGFLNKYWNVPLEPHPSLSLWTLTSKIREVISFRTALVEATMDLIFIFLAAIMWDMEESLVISAELFMITTIFMFIILPSSWTYIYIFYVLRVLIFWCFFFFVLTKEMSLFWMATAFVSVLCILNLYPLCANIRCCAPKKAQV